MSGSRFKRAFLLLLLVSLALSQACNFPGFPNQQLPAPTQPIPLSPSSTPAPTPIPTLPSTAGPTPTQTITISPQPSSTFIPSPTAIYQPVFEPAACQFSIPPGYNPDCGYLLVPEDRLSPGSRILRLHVAIFHSSSPDPAPDPVIYLSGGPGSPALDNTGYFLSRGLNTLLGQRDLIVFDQRGAGSSLPGLNCPERNDLTYDLLAQDLSNEQASLLIVEAFRRCRDRLVEQGVNLSSYNSRDSAADVEDLRRTLGSPQLNLLGVSYGTRLALTVMREFPGGIRSVVLDSAYPPQVNLYTELALNAERAFNVFFDGCASDQACSSEYPDLRTVFYSLVDQLNANPIAVSTIDPWSGLSRKAMLSGDLLIDVLFTGLYNRDVIATLPKLIYDVRSGDYSLVSQRLSLYFSRSTALGMQISVQCHEEFPFTSLDQAYHAAQGVEGHIAAFFPASLEPYFKICELWGAGQADLAEKQPVASDIPALILAGENDPITPPVWGQQTGESLTQSYFYTFPGVGHWVTRSTACAMQMVANFLERPDLPPDPTCISQMGSIRFTP